MVTLAELMDLIARIACLDLAELRQIQMAVDMRKYDCEREDDL